MLNVIFIVTVLTAIAMVIIGLAVFMQSQKTKLNLIFVQLVVSLVSWLLLNYLSSNPQEPYNVALWSNRLVLVAGGITMFLLLKFMLQLCSWNFNNKYLKALTVFNLLSWILCLTKLVIHDVKIINNDVINVFGPLAFVYFVSLFITTIAFIVTIILGYKKNTGESLLQLKAISKGFIFVAIIVVIGNAVMPVLGIYSLVNYTPLSILIVVATIAYAMKRYNLFEIKLIIIRTISYLLSLSAVLLIFVVVTHELNIYLVKGSNSVQYQKYVNIIIVFITAVAFGPIKRIFDKYSNRIFFRDVYDPQEFLNQLNTKLVSNEEINTLLRKSTALISTYLNPTFAGLAVNDNEEGFKHAHSTKDLGLTLTEINRVIKYMKNTSGRTVLYQGDDIFDKGVRDIFKKHQIGLITELTVNKELIGLLGLGERKSGNSYNSRDVQLLETAADSIAIAVQSALRFEEIEEFNANLQKKIDVATHDLQKSNEKLRALDEAKDDFISMASHQLRTPLTSVKGYISMVLEGDAGKINDLQRKFLNQSFISSQRMVFLISDLLNASRLQTGKFVIENKETYLPDVVAEEVDQLIETAKAHELQLIYKKPSNFPTVNIDENKIRQVIMNFADNSIYYTQAGGKIEIRLKATPTTIEYTVTDNGMGVPKHEQRHLFTKFYRAGNAKKARPDGTGLGIYMAKKVIVAQGGSVIFKSTEGKGSVFGFSLPRHKVEIGFSQK